MPDGRCLATGSDRLKRLNTSGPAWLLFAAAHGPRRNFCSRRGREHASRWTASAEATMPPPANAPSPGVWISPSRSIACTQPRSAAARSPASACFGSFGTIGAPVPMSMTCVPRGGLSLDRGRVLCKGGRTQRMLQRPFCPRPLRVPSQPPRRYARTTNAHRSRR